MRAYVYERSGETYALAMQERANRRPGAGEVSVRVRAASLNYRDLVALRNKAGRDVGGRIPLSDGAGEVVAVGDGVTNVRPGDRVAGCFFQTWESGPFEMSAHKNDLGGTLDGMLAEEVVLRAGGVVRIPSSYSFEEAACLPCAALTAWQSLVERAALKKGQTVLTLGTGGVSVFALQFATAMGARVIVTSSSDEKLAKAKALGGAETINYRTSPEWEKEVWRLTEGRGADVVIEVGGPGTLGKSLASVAPGGTIALIGVLTGFGPPDTTLFPLMAKNANLCGIYVGSRMQFEAMNAFLETQPLRPVIDRVFPFVDAAKAFDYLESGDHFGKIVVAID
ncbi:MAG TPA: NAD(P)-dependent alcohol dehydrogenase [Pirellulaceae bacterium]|jgi:NADPH:quinone reductase-like Zn-dependent oxidoreductase|nr:NAD(P)-dependent alcohol dehydrogenase [Pirellulaceae bacterium]